ncbi:similar to An18g05240 [Aspergillus luchuensis]|uniref:Similar to An18g05240 n=1 Tax=Aspergillus kawachii TaxID=1069201 RepID=A0A146F6G9_ASPKA|nr:similar to An18g05240 [Aspergillus luchuensis]
MSHPQRTTTTATATATSADPLTNPSTASTSDGASNKALRILFGVLRLYEDFKSAKVLVVGKACTWHHLKDRSLKKIEILVNTDVPPVTLRGYLIFDRSGYFSISSSGGCSFNMKLGRSTLIPCTLDTVTSRQLSPTARDLELRIYRQAFGRVHELQYVPQEEFPFVDLPSVILMEVLLPSEPKTIIDSPRVWKLAQRLDPQFRWEDWQRNALEARLTRLIDLAKKDEKRTREEWRAVLHLQIDELADGVEDESTDGEDELADGVEDESTDGEDELADGVEDESLDGEDELADGVEDESMDGEDELADGVEDEPLENNPNSFKDVFMRKVQPVCGSRSRPDSGGLWFSGGDAVSTGENMLKCFTYRTAMCYGMA